MDETYICYLGDLGYLIREMAEEAKRDSVTEPSEYAVGYLMAIHAIVSLMQQQAITFEIPLDELNLQNLPESFFFSEPRSDNSQNHDDPSSQAV